MMVILELMYVFFKIGLFGFGGGYAMLSLIQFEVVDRFQWLTLQEFSDIIAISQMTPGPISINLATYVGYSVAGFGGATIATLSLCMPSIILMFLVTKFLIKNKENHYVQAFFSGLRPVLAGLILAAALLLMNKENFCDFGLGEYNISTAIFLVSFIVLYFFKTNPIWVLVGAGAAGFLFM